MARGCGSTAAAVALQWPHGRRQCEKNADGRNWIDLLGLRLLPHETVPPHTLVPRTLCHDHFSDRVDARRFFFKTEIYLYAVLDRVLGRPRAVHGTAEVRMLQGICHRNAPVRIKREQSLQEMDRLRRGAGKLFRERCGRRRVPSSFEQADDLHLAQTHGPQLCLGWGADDVANDVQLRQSASLLVFVFWAERYAVPTWEQRHPLALWVQHHEKLGEDAPDGPSSRGTGGKGEGGRARRGRSRERNEKGGFR